MDAVTDGRVRIIPRTLRQGLPRLAGGKTRLARQPAAVVGTSHSRLVARRVHRTKPVGRTVDRALDPSSRDVLAATGRVSGRASRVDELAVATRPHRRRARLGARLPARRRLPSGEARLEALGCRRRRTCWTPGSARPSGRTRRWAGPRRRPSWSASIPRQRLITSRDIITLWVAPHGADRLEQHGRAAVSRRLHPSEDPGRLRRDHVQVQGQRHRPAWT